MEPASLDSNATDAPSREGSLENPIQVENVPGHVIPILTREFDDFDTESTRFLRGAASDAAIEEQGQPGIKSLRDQPLEQASCIRTNTSPGAWSLEGPHVQQHPRPVGAGIAG